MLKILFKIFRKSQSTKTKLKNRIKLKINNNKVLRNSSKLKKTNKVLYPKKDYRKS